GTDTRLIVVGGAGSLYLDKEHTAQLYKSPDFPEEYVEIATSQVEELAYLRTRNDVKWTFFSPAADFDDQGKKTGSYTLGGEEFILNKANESYISYADYAVALVDEIENRKFIGKRFTAVGERA
ncbi:MAG: NAD(P)-dependent oxidoreductase, partial [Succinivibrio sp.]|nr:NAD(P)-dependent oxidoreductase [Succinivibrio sp.]